MKLLENSFSNPFCIKTDFGAEKEPIQRYEISYKQSYKQIVHKTERYIV